MRRKLAAIVVLGLVVALSGAPAPAPAHIDVTVHEGTSMSVAVSPDGRTLAIDLQGSIWTMPAAGGAATRITDIFNDARQPIVVARRQVDRLLRLSRRRLRHLGDRARRHRISTS